MLNGIVIFHGGTGALIFHKRFAKTFGLPGAATQPTLADPVGLALQLYAFSKFSASVSSDMQLQHFALGGTAGDIFLTSKTVGAEDGSESATTTSESPSSSVHLVLALFAAMPFYHGVACATALLDAFLAEHATRKDCSRPGPFNLLGAALEAFVDYFVFAIAAALPRPSAWLLVLFNADGGSAASHTSESAVLRRQTCEPPALLVREPEVLQPLLPTAPPPQAGGRQLLSQRLLRRFPNASIQRPTHGRHFTVARHRPAEFLNGDKGDGPSRANTSGCQFGCVPDTVLAPAELNGALGSGPPRPLSAPPRGGVLAQGMMSWWRSRRGSSRSVNTRIAVATSSQGDGQRRFEVFYAADESSVSNHFADSIAARATQSSKAVCSLLNLEQDGLQSGTTDHSYAVVLRVGDCLQVVLPTKSLAPEAVCVAGDSVTVAECVRQWRYEVETKFEGLNRYLQFLVSFRSIGRQRQRPEGLS